MIDETNCQNKVHRTKCKNYWLNNISSHVLQRPDPFKPIEINLAVRDRRNEGWLATFKIRFAAQTDRGVAMSLEVDTSVISCPPCFVSRSRCHDRSSLGASRSRWQWSIPISKCGSCNAVNIVCALVCTNLILSIIWSELAPPFSALFPR